MLAESIQLKAANCEKGTVCCESGCFSQDMYFNVKNLHGPTVCSTSMYLDTLLINATYASPESCQCQWPDLDRPSRLQSVTEDRIFARMLPRFFASCQDASRIPVRSAQCADKMPTRMSGAFNMHHAAEH